jgi:hypothetical protein
MNQPTIPLDDTRKVFWEKGACSHTFFYLLNREFGHLREAEEKGTDPLAGGIVQKGHQCGMLWGAAMAVGAEAYRRSDKLDQAIALAMKATQNIVQSFSKRTESVDCKKITGTDFSKPLQMIRYMLFRARSCFKLAEDWAPEAVISAKEGLEQGATVLPEESKSCASELVRRMGGSEEQMAMAAGLGGGLGFSGSACGALSAAIWMNSMSWSQENPGKSPYGNAYAKQTLKKFLEETDGEMLCPKLAGKEFSSVEEHTEFVKNGGCRKLIDLLVNTANR